MCQAGHKHRRLMTQGSSPSVQYSNYDAFGNTLDVKELDFGGALLTRNRYDIRAGPSLQRNISSICPPRFWLRMAPVPQLLALTLATTIPGSINTNITDAASHDKFADCPWQSEFNNAVR